MTSFAGGEYTPTTNVSGGSSGANKELSNLNPTSINQDLVFDNTGFAIRQLKTDDASASQSLSQTLEIVTGDVATQQGDFFHSPGPINIRTGSISNINKANGGNIQLITGDITGAGDASSSTGDITMATGTPNVGDSGRIQLSVGDALNVGDDAGLMQFLGGGAERNGTRIRIRGGSSVNPTSSVAGQIELIAGSSTNGVGGELSLESGSSSTNDGGDINIFSGQCASGSVGGSIDIGARTGGQLLLRTLSGFGDGGSITITPANGAANSSGGVLNLYTGSGNGTGVAGNMGFITGNATSPGGSNYFFQAGTSAGTKGYINFDVSSIRHNQNPSTEVVWESGGARPGSPVTGQRFFDTNINTPIWWTGAAWVDGVGTAV